MTYIMHKVIKGNVYDYEYESVWENGRSRTRYVGYIGRSGGSRGSAGKLGVRSSVVSASGVPTAKLELGVRSQPKPKLELGVRSQPITRARLGTTQTKLGVRARIGKLGTRFVSFFRRGKR